VRRRRLTFILVIQAILFLGHFVVYETWTSFWRTADPPGISALAIVFLLLSVSFVGASLLAFRYYNVWVRAFYMAAAGWLGMLNFFFLASLACWIVNAGVRVTRGSWEPRDIAEVLFGAAAVAGVWGIVNASWVRVKRIDLRIAELPGAWHGKVAALASDLHLGTVRSEGFARRIVAMINEVKPDVVFLTGDFYDGTAVDAERVARPLAELRAQHGVYFVTGNHEEFADPRKYIDALSAAGVRVLNNECVAIDGLQIVGVPYHELATSEGYVAALQESGLDRERPSILLVHAPNRLWESAEAGVSLHLCGHTHQGQFFPWTRVVARIYGKFAYGFHRLNYMQAYTTCGAGTWGPPVRLGSNPEIVVMRFQ